MNLILTGESVFPEPVIDVLELTLRDGRQVVVDWDVSLPAITGPSLDLWYGRFEAHMEQVYFQPAGEEKRITLTISELKDARISAVQWYSCTNDTECEDGILIDGMVFEEDSKIALQTGLLNSTDPRTFYSMIRGQEEICPVCGAKVTYLDSCPDFLWWECNGCGTTGKEGTDYLEGDKIFCGYHYDVQVRARKVQEEEGGMVTFNQILDSLPVETEGHFWTDANQILCRTKELCEAVADFLKALGLDVVTGYYDPQEDSRDQMVDHYTGWYYIDIN